MRSDVNKVLTECYKENRGGAKRNGNMQFRRAEIARHFDEVGGKFGMGFKNSSKSFGENLAYLPRFLKKNVGRKWNDIYSEIAANLDRRSATQEHIFQHLFGYFLEAKEIIIVDDVPMQRPRRHGDEPNLIDKYNNLYVDPRDGILKKVPARSKVKTKYELIREENLAKKKVLNSFEELHQMGDGFWYVFTLKPIPQPTIGYEFTEPYPYGDLEAQEQWAERYRAFRSLSVEERALIGRKRIDKGYTKDLENKILPNNISDLTKTYTRLGHRKGWITKKATHYYASMRSASKKELRSVGL